MTVEERSAIRREVRVAAKPETIFALLTDPAKYIRWKGKVAELDARPVESTGSSSTAAISREEAMWR